MKLLSAVNNDTTIRVVPYYNEHGRNTLNDHIKDENNTFK